MLTIGILGGVVLTVICASGLRTDKGGWAAEAAAETGPISIRDARKESLGGRLETIMTFGGQNGKFLFLLALAGGIIIGEMVVITIQDLAQFTTGALEGVARSSILVVTEATAA